MKTIPTELQCIAK